MTTNRQYYAASCIYGHIGMSSFNGNAWNVYRFDSKAERDKFIEEYDDEHRNNVRNNARAWRITKLDAYKALKCPINSTYKYLEYDARTCDHKSQVVTTFLGEIK